MEHHAFTPATLGSGLCFICGLLKDRSIHQEIELPAKTAECPTCGAYMMNPAKHRDFHQWLERQSEMSQAMGSV
jgi:hypothetical protein